MIATFPFYKPDSTTRLPGLMNKLKIITLASKVKMICVLVFIHADHNSGVGSSAYKYLLPVCDVIYGEPSIANVLQDNHILSQSFGHG